MTDKNGSIYWTYDMSSGTDKVYKSYAIRPVIELYKTAQFEVIKE